MNSERAVIDAIRARQPIELSRDGEPMTRILHPHILWVSSTGKVILDSWQVDGHSSSGDLPKWSTIPLDEIVEVEALEGGFEIADTYAPDSQKYRHGVVAGI